MNKLQELRETRDDATTTEFERKRNIDSMSSMTDEKEWARVKLY